MLPLQARVDLGVMAMKGYSTFPKAPALLDLTIRLFSVISRTLVGGGVLPLCRGAVGVFYSPSWLGNLSFNCCPLPMSSWRKREPFHLSINLYHLTHQLTFFKFNLICQHSHDCLYPTKQECIHFPQSDYKVIDLRPNSVNHSSIKVPHPL